MIHREGKFSLAAGLLFCLLLLIGSRLIWPQSAVAFWASLISSLFIMAALLQFFRNPPRTVHESSTQVLAPADGKVVVIEETTESEYLRTICIQVSIFMSPVNVHVNRNPVTGMIEYIKYHPGKFLVAWHPKSSTDNERTTVVYRLPSGNHIALRQIAGAMARRIVYYLQPGMQAIQGQEMGFIKFGSRVDLFLPLGTQILVKPGEKVWGGRTVLANLCLENGQKESLS